MLFLIDRYYDQPNADQFARVVVEVSQNLECDPDKLMAIMYFESKLRPWARNSKGSSVGLIQINKNQAERLGTTDRKMESMSGPDQMEVVMRHLWPYKGLIGTLGDMWAASYCPRVLGCAPTEEIRVPIKFREANNTFPLNIDNKIRFHRLEESLSRYFKRFGKEF